MSAPRWNVWILIAQTLFMHAGAAAGQPAATGPAQAYPYKPIRIVTTGIGGGNDFMSRLIAQGISGPLGQPVVVDNRGSSIIPAQVVSLAPPDGYSLLFASSSLWIIPLIQQAPYDAVRDFAPVSMIDRAPNILVVQASLPVNSVAELIAYAKARPGALNYGSGGTGTSLHLAAELFQAMAGVKMVHITYKGGGLSINALLAGELQLMFAPATLVTQHLKSGKLKALAVTSAEPSVLLPGMPTVAAAGLPGYEAASIDGVFARAGTPSVIVNRLNREIVRFLNQPEIKEKFLNTGVEMVGSSPEQLAAAIKSDIARMGKVVRDAGIRVQ